MKNTKRTAFLISIAALLASPTAFADAGVPMVIFGFPFMLAVFIPVCMVELRVFSRTMAIPVRPLVKPVVLANLVSTVAGYPLSWGVMLGLEFLSTGGAAWGLSNVWTALASVTLQAAWLVPYESELYWMIPAAGLVGLIPAFFISVVLERFILARFTVSGSSFEKHAVWKANLCSYLLLATILVALLGFALLKHR